MAARSSLLIATIVLLLSFCCISRIMSQCPPASRDSNGQCDDDESAEERCDSDCRVNRDALYGYCDPPDFLGVRMCQCCYTDDPGTGHESCIDKAPNGQCEEDGEDKCDEDCRVGQDAIYGYCETDVLGVTMCYCCFKDKDA